MNKFKEKFNKVAVPAMNKKFGYKNALATPKIIKVVVSSGIGSFKDEAKKEAALKSFTQIVGQKPLINKAKKSIASFKLREGMVVGYSATLRGPRMYDFLEKLVSVAIPRVRDFRGLERKLVDQMGNMSIGFQGTHIFSRIRRGRCPVRFRIGGYDCYHRQEQRGSL